jgi:hypothetical protein
MGDYKPFAVDSPALPPGPLNPFTHDLKKHRAIRRMTVFVLTAWMMPTCLPEVALPRQLAIFLQITKKFLSFPSKPFGYNA